MDGDMDDVRRPCIWMRWAARILALLWAGFWVWFGLASGIAEGIGVIGTIIHTAMPGLILLASALFAWSKERIGGILLIVEGLIIAIAYPLMTMGHFPILTIIYVLLTMSLPPIVAGILFLISHRRISEAPAP